MEKAICSQCQKPKANLECGLCQCSLCKACAQFVEEDRFSFLAKVPEDLSHTVYCDPCYAAKIAPEIEIYDNTMELAKNIHVFDKSQGKETRLIKRLEEPLKVVDCTDRNETVLRLAFFTAQKKYNAIVDVELKYEKIKNGSYQTMKWSGSGIPANVDSAKLVKDRSTWHQPN